MYLRTVLLNHLLSQSTSQAPDEHTPPTHGFEELFEYVKSRTDKGVAIEFLTDADSDDLDDAGRIDLGKKNKLDFVRLKFAGLMTHESRRYAVLLIHHVDQKNRSFPVVNLDTYEGREITAAENERGVSSAHVVVSLPVDNEVDDASYRCVVEFTPGITRRSVEFLINRQIRRAASWEFSVEQVGRRGTPVKPKIYKYKPKIRLASDIYQNLLTGDKIGLFSSAVFTKRSTKENTAKEIDLLQEDIVADIQLRISGNQAPTDPTKRKSWLKELVNFYDGLGYKSKLYYRHLNGSKYRGTHSTEADGAADRLLCNTASYELTTERPKWDNTVHQPAVDELVKILRRDELWQRPRAD